MDDRLSTLDYGLWTTHAPPLPCSGPPDRRTHPPASARAC
jgi:hypothetical protein